MRRKFIAWKGYDAPRDEVLKARRVPPEAIDKAANSYKAQTMPEKPFVEDAGAEQMRKQKVDQLMRALQDLDESERDIIKRVFGIGYTNPMSIEEVAVLLFPGLHKYNAQRKAQSLFRRAMRKLKTLDTGALEALRRDPSLDEFT